MNSSPDLQCDAALLRSAKASRQAVETLALRYTKLVRICARPFYLAGADAEDLMQEGMIGLLAAIAGYDPDRGVPFGAYAARCIRSRIISAVRTGTAEKHAPLNQAVSLQASYAAAADTGPEMQLIARETVDEYLALLRNHLSPMEAQILDLYLDGLSTGEMAEQLGRSEKSVDNAVQRIKRKAMREKFSETGTPVPIAI